MKTRPSQVLDSSRVSAPWQRTVRRRIESLDALRGIAALSVVLWHWQHFFPLGETPGDHLPLYWLLWPFYNAGYWGVDLFFCISGFVFFSLYAQRVSRSEVSASQFFVLRISRLYPLHLVTLFVVAVLQAVHTLRYGHTFIYDHNNWKQFLLQLAMISNWFPNDLTFNGPAWSLSIEMLLYISFFIVCSMRLTQPAFVACLCISGLFVWKFDQQIGRGLLSFYLGCLSAIVVGQIHETRKLSVAVLLSIAAVLAAALLAFIASNNLGSLEMLTRVVIFPALVIVLALFDQNIEALTVRLRWLGDISYSSYLLHFPLQLAVVTTGVAIDYSSPVTLLCFFAVLLAAALASFHWFEKPVMNAMRSRIPLAVSFRRAG